MSGVVDSSIHAGPVCPIDVLLGFNPVNWQANVMSGRCGAAETPNTCNTWSGTLMLTPSTVDVHVRNDMTLQDLVSMSDPLYVFWHDASISTWHKKTSWCCMISSRCLIPSTCFDTMRPSVHGIRKPDWCCRISSRCLIPSTCFDTMRPSVHGIRKRVDAAWSRLDVWSPLRVLTRCVHQYMA